MSIRKSLIGAVILIVAVLSWAVFALSLSRSGGDIAIWAADALNKVALPYRMAKLSLQEPDAQLLVPIRGLSLNSIADTWGDARSGGRTHEGVDMFAARGTPVFSATDGIVLRSGTNALGGNIVFVMGAGGIRYYYAHLDRIAQGIAAGTPVTTDTVLGFVGTTGNAEGTPPHLHFGMYQNGAKDPYDLLIAR